MRAWIWPSIFDDTDGLIMKIVRWCNSHPGAFRGLLFVLSAIPGLSLLWDYHRDALGFNPFDALIVRSGFWAIAFLLLTLAITPLRRWFGAVCQHFRLSWGKRLADWNFLIQSRRMLGLYSFFYLSCHLFVFLHFEVDWDWPWFWEDINERRFLMIGLMAWTMSLLLALTSPMLIRRTMGKHWRRLHRLMYPLCILAVVHVWMEHKVGETDAYFYLAITLALLLHRLMTTLARWRRTDDDGMEAQRVV